MAAGRIVLPPYFPARDRNARLVPGALLAVYIDNTTTKAAIYSDQALMTAQTNPVPANSSGQFPAIWCEAGTAEVPVLYSLAISDADGRSIGNPAYFTGWQPSVDAETANLALAEAAAASAAEYYGDILALAGAYPDPAALATRAAKAANGSDFASPAAVRVNIGADLSTNVNYTAPIASAVERTVAAKLGDTVSLLDVLGDGYDPDADDASAALVDAATEAAAEGKTLVLSGMIRLENCASIIGVDDLCIHFDNPIINALDTGTGATLTNGATGKVALLFKDCARLRLTGAAAINGLGTVGTTPLAGVVYDTVTDSSCPVSLKLDNMAAGVFAWWCENSQFGDLLTTRMKGTQTFDAGTAGTSLVCISNYNCQFGRTTAYLNYKPIVYMSLTSAFGGLRTDNELCSFGPVQGTGVGASIEGSLITLRSAIRCTFVGGTGAGFAHGLLITRYASDTHADGVFGNFVGYVIGDFPATGASLDGAVTQELGDVGAPAIGHNTVGFVDAVCAGETGISVSTGSLHIGFARISGGVRPIELKNSMLTAETLVVENQDQEAVMIAQGANLRVGLIDVRTGSVGGVSAAVRYDSTYPGGAGGRGNIEIGEIRYAQNGTGSNVVWVFMDLAADGGAAAQRIGHINGTGSTAQARFGSDSYSVQAGRFLSAAAPTSGAYGLGFTVWNSAPAAAGAPGWVCTTAGTPGTFKAMANLAA